MASLFEVSLSVVDILKQHDPQRAPMAPHLLAAYVGRELELLAMLKRCYHIIPHGVPTGTGASSSPAEYRHRVARYYQRWCPEKLPHVDAILVSFKGHEELALLSMVEKYRKPEPPREEEIAVPADTETRKLSVVTIQSTSPDNLSPHSSRGSSPISRVHSFTNRSFGTGTYDRTVVSSAVDVRVAEFARVIYEQRAHIELLEGRALRCTCGVHASSSALGGDEACPEAHAGVLVDALRILADVNPASRMMAEGNAAVPPRTGVWVRFPRARRYKQRTAAMWRGADGEVSSVRFFKGPEAREELVLSTVSHVMTPEGSLLAVHAVQHDGSTVALAFGSEGDRVGWYVWLMRWTTPRRHMEVLAKGSGVWM